MRDFEYYAPPSLNEALSLLNNWKGKAKVLAGGTDLAVQMKNGCAHPGAIIDVKNIPELNHLEWHKNKTLHIGAAVPFCQILSFPLVKERFSILYQACSLIGSVQIRNRGTIGGNICNAAPSGDALPPLLCLGAMAIATTANGTRKIPLESFFRGPGQSILASDELLVAIEIPDPPSLSTGCYLRLTNRQEMDISIVNVASFLVLTKGKHLCHEARIALGAVAPTPIRASQAEMVLVKKVLTDDAIEEAAERAAVAARPISDVRGSAEYRREMVKVLTRRTLKKARDSILAGIDRGEYLL